MPRTSTSSAYCYYQRDVQANSRNLKAKKSNFLWYKGAFNRKLSYHLCFMDVTWLMHLVVGLSLKSFVFESAPFWMRFTLDDVPLEQVLRTPYYSLRKLYYSLRTLCYSLNTYSVVAFASFTSLLPSLGFFVATKRSRLYTEEKKISSVTEVRRINTFCSIVGERWVTETHTRTSFV